MKSSRSNKPTPCGDENQTAAGQTAVDKGDETSGRGKRSRKSISKIEAAAAFPGQVDLRGEFADDRCFLDDIITRVHRAISTGDLELKTEHAFKAIELKQKISENSQVENLLLDLLNEIRRQELMRSTDESFSGKSSE